MGCDYYSGFDLCVEFTKGKVVKINLEHNRSYCSSSNNDSDDESDPVKRDINSFLQRNPDKILFENEKWVKDAYEKNFGHYVAQHDIKIIKKITKVSYAYERL
jgi:hypothetical protein